MISEAITLRVREAWESLRRLPNSSVPGYRTAWPDVVRDYRDAYGYAAPTLRLKPASPQAIDRMHETFTWFVFVGSRQKTRALWLIDGCGMGPRRAGDILGCHRNTARAWRNDALDLISEGLRKSTVARVRIVHDSAAFST